MDDQELYELAMERKSLDAEMADLKLLMKPLDEAIIAELQNRRTKRIENDEGLKITLVAGETTEYPYSRFVQEFGTGVTATLRPDKIDKDKLADAIQEGIIDPARAAQLLQVTPKSPYIRVT